MSLFQNSVLNKYLKGIDSEKAEKAWNTFKSHFHNPEIQENIRNSKEEQYQGEFLIDLFVNVFGYVKNPNPNFNLTTELKNIKGAKKTDGAILKDDKAIAVIELKGTNTVDLAKVENQAFGYKNNQPGCTYVITSNFEKLRFYIDNAVEYEEFNLFQLTKERFHTLYLCLSKENLLKGIPKQIKDESLTREETVTKQLYKDYSQFRNEIFDDIQKQNPEHNKLTLFKKTQKLLDRFLFIFFAEDRLLLPPNSIREIVTQWTDLRDKYDEYQPLYNRFKKYFGYMNTGYEGKKYEIFAYNGGLFAPDEILDTIKISDDLLYKHTVNLSNYDFESEVSVNILGHIFEHSLTEIETIQAQLEGQEIDKSKTKRKKDGVFYTPKYITKYMVDNTVGKLCLEKKVQIGIDESNFEKERKGRKKATLKKLTAQLDEYRNWLLQITICDPACGSGAFLNQALEFLIKEHRYLDELKAKLLGDTMVFSEVQNEILENNIFGVDINEESVEIAKLSLWLRTAKKGRKLTTLNNNIKCGNSLIDDPKITGIKAFNWAKEFPDIFSNGGFDIIIGNPPYGMDQNKNNHDYYKQSYSYVEGRAELFELFIEKSLSVFAETGILSFIIPNTLLSNLYSKKLREYIVDNFTLIEITNFGMDVFNDPTVHTCIVTLDKQSVKSTNIKKQINSLIELESPYDYQVDQTKFKNSENCTFDIFFDPNESKFIQKIEQNAQLKEICYIRQCIKTGNDKIFVKKSNLPLETPWRSVLRGKGMNRYVTFEKNLYLKYGDWLARNWKNKTFYETEKIIIRETGKRITATIDFDNNYLLSSLYSIYPKEKFNSTYLKALLAIINSELASFYIRKIAYELTKGAFTKVRTNQLGRLPIVSFNKEEESFLAQQVDEIINLYALVYKQRDKFLNRVSTNLVIEKLSTKLTNFYSHNFISFIKELKKQKIKLSLTEQDEWEEYFNTSQININKTLVEINKIDKGIDKKVYDLYELDEEEILIVEKANS